MPQCPENYLDVYAENLANTLTEFHINTGNRVACFLGQLAHESGELRYWEELSTGEQYEGRNDLGNIHPGDGPRYKGRGPIQLTGRANYTRAGDELGEPYAQRPVLLLEPLHGFKVAGWYWSYFKHLNELADVMNVERITLKINGGVNGLGKRWEYTRKALSVLARTAELL